MDFQPSNFHILDTLLVSLGATVFIKSVKTSVLCLTYFNISKEAATCVRTAHGKVTAQVKERQVCVEHHCIFVHDSNSMK